MILTINVIIGILLIVDVDMQHPCLKITGLNPITELSPSAQQEEALSHNNKGLLLNLMNYGSF